MKNKIILLSAPLVFTLLLFSACSTSNSSSDIPGAVASLSSDSEAATIKQSLNFANEQLSAILDATKASTKKEFYAALENPDVLSINYSSERNIKIKDSEKIKKPLSVSSAGSVKLNSETDTLIIEKAAKGFIAKAAPACLIINGENVVAEIKGGAGEVYIMGKDAKLHIYDGEIKKIFAVNSTSVIINHCDMAISVILANGTKTVVEAKHTYSLKNNLVSEGVINP